MVHTVPIPMAMPYLMIVKFRLPLTVFRYCTIWYGMTRTSSLPSLFNFILLLRVVQ